MTENQRDAEIGRTIREYKEQDELIACLRARLSRSATAINDLLKAIDEKSDPSLVATAAANAAKQAGVTNVAEAMTELSEAWQKRETMRKSLEAQGYGRVIQ